MTLAQDEMPILAVDSNKEIHIVILKDNGTYKNLYIGDYLFKIFGIRIYTKWYYTNAKSVFNRLPKGFGFTLNSQMFADLYKQ